MSSLSTVPFSRLPQIIPRSTDQDICTIELPTLQTVASASPVRVSESCIARTLGSLALTNRRHNRGHMKTKDCRVFRNLCSRYDCCLNLHSYRQHTSPLMPSRSSKTKSFSASLTAFLWDCSPRAWALSLCPASPESFQRGSDTYIMSLKHGSIKNDAGGWTASMPRVVSFGQFIWLGSW